MSPSNVGSGGSLAWVQRASFQYLHHTHTCLTSTFALDIPLVNLPHWCILAPYLCFCNVYCTLQYCILVSARVLKIAVLTSNCCMCFKY